MGPSARVGAIDDIEAFRGALSEFLEEVQAALGGVNFEVRRAQDWLKQDRWSYWQCELKQARAAVAEARTQLSRKRITTAHGTPKDTVEKEMLRDAERRQDEAERKLALIKKWAPILDQAVLVYQGHSRPLGDTLAIELPNALARLKRMIEALEAYVAVAPPSSEPVRTEGPTVLPSSVARPTPEVVDEAVEPPPSEGPTAPD
jgi:hypothetical protein